MTKFNNKRLLKGILAVNKPSGISSFDVVAYIQNLLKCYYWNHDFDQVQLPQGIGKYKGCFKLPARKVGHGGTLDPLAQGVMILAIGDSTKELKDYLNGSKEYRVEAQLGITMDTMDSTGKIIEEKTCENIKEQDILNLIPKFVGTYEQKPPIYSAIRKDGVRLYTLAREKDLKLEDIDIPTRTVTCNSILLENFKELQNQKYFQLKVNCEKGFYIRSLTHDIGQLLGVGAIVTKLIRIRQGDFKLENALELNDIKDIQKFLK